jgi:DNA polymerase
VPLAGDKLRVGLGYSTARASFDLETYSEAGFAWSAEAGKWLKTATDAQGRGGLPAVGAAVYAQHPSTEVLSMAYDLKDGRGRRLWFPHQPPPADLCVHVGAGGEVEAHGAKFELWIWEFVLVLKHGFPPLDPQQVFCTMGKARAWSLPPSLDMVGNVLNIEHRKDADGKRLIDKFSVPHNPSKKDPRQRVRPAEEPVDAARLYAYNERDVLAEDEVSALIPDMPAARREYWLLDRAINRRGIPVDRAGVENCIVVLEQALTRYNAELAALTGGAVTAGSQGARLIGWLAGKGCFVESLEAEVVEGKLTELRAWRDHCEDEDFIPF